VAGGPVNHERKVSTKRDLRYAELSIHLHWILPLTRPTRQAAS
jgi:hypothetical protein